MRRPIVLALLLSGCAASPAPDPLILPPDPPPIAVEPVVRAPAKSSAPAPLTPSEIIVAADQGRTDATGYVAWKHSKAENIDRLTTLTAALNAAVAKMRAGYANGKYVTTDVMAARSALAELRSFLSNKGD